VAVGTLAVIDPVVGGFDHPTSGLDNAHRMRYRYVRELGMFIGSGVVEAGCKSVIAFNQCLRVVKSALTDRKTDSGVDVPWTGFDLINTFNAWKTAAAGRVFTTDIRGSTEFAVTGLVWRREVGQQVFEEAAVDLGKGLKSWSDSRSGKRRGKRVATLQEVRPGTSRRFVCATNTPKTNRRPSVSATMIAHGRSHCPASG
jgi:hypothetical protein